MTASRQEREAPLDLLSHVSATAAEQRTEPAIESEFRAMQADEVEHHTDRLPGTATQPATKLLQEERRTVRRTQ